MPGNVANAVVPTVGGTPLVFPAGLSRAFTEVLTVEARVNEYRDGTTQRQALVSNDRRSWKLSRRLVPTDAVALRTFALTYPTAAFYFYNPKDVSAGQLEGSNYDATGANLQGRYKVRLNWGELSEESYIPRTDMGVELVEVA